MVGPHDVKESPGSLACTCLAVRLDGALPPLPFASAAQPLPVAEAKPGKEQKKLALQTQVQSLAPLLELPALAEVRVASDDTDANRAAAAELQRRGVKLEKPL